MVWFLFELMSGMLDHCCELNGLARFAAGLQ